MANSENNFHINTWFDFYSQFGAAMGVRKGTINDAPADQIKWAELGLRLINEEVNLELFPALLTWQENPSLENLAEVADACIDSIYVINQLMYSMGIPANEIFAAVHSANMAKVDPVTGLVRRREDGKVLKPEGWKAPDVWQILADASSKQHFAEGTGGAENWNKGDA